ARSLGHDVHARFADDLTGAAVGDAVDGGAALEADAHGAEWAARLARDGGAAGAACDSDGDCDGRSGFDGDGLAVESEVDGLCCSRCWRGVLVHRNSLSGLT